MYVGTKSLLKKAGWNMIGGQPPRGSDALPVIEVKSGLATMRGSYGAYKPDLVAHKDGVLLLVECKPGHDLNDIDKLRGLLTDPGRLAALMQELQQRKLLDRCNIPVGLFPQRVFGALAHGGSLVLLPDLIVIHVHDMFGRGCIYPPTDVSTSRGQLLAECVVGKAGS